MMEGILTRKMEDGRDVMTETVKGDNLRTEKSAVL